MEQWYILYDIPYQKDFVGYYALQSIDDLQWYILNDIPYQKRFVPLHAINDHPAHSGIWKILTDIPYQPDFQPHHELQPIGDTSWNILNDIPYQKQFAALQGVTAHPTHPGLWHILTDIPYQPEFPEYQALQPLASERWYILNDIPYKKEFSKLKGITKTPDHPDQWHILTDIPYQPKFPEWNELQPFEEFWHILTDIPYKKEFAELYLITEVPEHGDRWYILLGIPYQKAFPQWNALQPLSEQWNILTDIPYQKRFPQLHEVTTEPQHSGRWYILEDIPYQKQFPDYHELQPIPEQWNILYDIPYQKRFQKLHDITAEPQHSGRWYILEDIPYQKQFPDYYGLQPIPELWYILYDIPYQKEFPTLYDISAVPRHPGWYILLDIPYRREFPRLYSITAIPKHYTPKTYIVVGLGAVGRWQVRKCTEYDTENWTLLEDLGPTSVIRRAYIEADGDFDYIVGRESITLTTEGEPWLAVITSTKKLYVKQVCADINTAEFIDDDVEEAALCRGWKSDRYNVDAGLILVYRKQRDVLIRRYREVNGRMIWEAEDPLLENDNCTHIEVKRLNDYRIAVYVDNPNRVLVTDRYYIGGTAKTEYVDLKATSWINIATAHTVDEPAAQDFTFLTATIENDRFIRVHGKYPIYSIDRDVTNVTLTDSYHYSTMVDYTISNGDILVEMDKPKLNSYNLLSVIFSNANHIKYTAGASRTGVVPGQTISVENKFVPDEYVSLTATAVVGELVAIEKQRYNVSMPIESAVLTASTTVSELKNTPLNKMVIVVPAESVIFNASVTVSELTATQSGDLPV